MNLLELMREYVVCIKFPAMKQIVLLFIRTNWDGTFIVFLENLVINFTFRINNTTDRTITIHEPSLSRSVHFMHVRCVQGPAQFVNSPCWKSGWESVNFLLWELITAIMSGAS